MLVQILDSEKFDYIKEACRFYGIRYEIIEEQVDGSNIPASGEQNSSKAKGKRSIDSERSE